MRIFLHEHVSYMVLVFVFRYLQQIKAPIDGYSHILPDAIPETGIYVVDTADIFGALLGEDSPGNKRGLEQMCHHLVVPAKNLHNAGNDAYVSCRLNILGPS